MGSAQGVSGGAWACLRAVSHAISSRLAVLVSAILFLRGLLPSIGLRAKGACVCTTAKQHKQLLQDSQSGNSQAHAQQPAPPGYNPKVEQLRRTEFRRLEGRVYADYAGAAPYSERLLGEAVQELSASLHGNPHSEAGWAPENRSAAADAARLATLRWCNADPEQYCCIFTAGATAALKLVGESFPWSPASAFVHLRDNHTSVLGIRQLAAQHSTACPAAAVEVTAAPAGGERQAGVVAWYLGPCSGAATAGLAAAAKAADAAVEAGSSSERSSSGCSGADEPRHLFALPLESNFSGLRYDQRLVAAVQKGELQWVDCSSCKDSRGSDAGSGSCASGDRGSSDGGSDDSGGGSGGSSSARHPLPAGRWMVLLDAAKGAASSPPDLSRFPADFVALSYYKAFGWPTGLGALLVRRDALACLRRRYFGGGTVEVALADEAFQRLRPGPAGWEDGTPSFLDLPAVAAGFRFIERLGGFAAVAAHASAVASRLASQLAALRHWNGAPVCSLHGGHAVLQQQRQPRRQLRQGQQLKIEPEEQQRPEGCPCKREQLQQLAHAARMPPGVAGQGPVVTFNLRRADGSFVGYREVERLASLSGIMLRTGCCCNPGACAAALGLSAADMRANWEAGHVCWDGRDVINGRPTGAVRASFGYASALSDVEAIMALVRQYFVEDRPAAAALPHAVPAEQAAPAEGDLVHDSAASAVVRMLAGAGVPATPSAAAGDAAAGVVRASAAPAGPRAVGSIGALWVYPIKSCRGFSPSSWPLGRAGLLFDRCWALVDPSGAALRLKKHPALASISAAVDLQRRLLLVTAAGEQQGLEVPLPEEWEATESACCGYGSNSSSSSGGSSSGRSVVEKDAADGNSPASSESPRSPLSPASPEPFSVRVCSRTAWVQRSAAAAGGDAAAAAWFTRVLGTPCRLVQQAPQPELASHPAAGAGAGPGAEAGRAADKATGSGQSFANEGHLLVLGAASLADLARRAGSLEAPEAFAQRFRPNLVVEGCSAYAEDSWRSLSLLPAADRAGSAVGGRQNIPTPAASASTTTTSHGCAACSATTGVPAASGSAAVQLSSVCPCARCDVVCIDPLTGRRSGPEPLLSLAGYRRSGGRISFGQLMNVQRQDLRPQQQKAHSTQQSTGCLGSCTHCGTAASSRAYPLWVAVGDRLSLTA